MADEMQPSTTFEITNIPIIEILQGGEEGG